MLKEMRDAAGDSGEFYTPRAVVRFIVEVVNPRLGEVILDPACGTGGFLVESFKHLEKQCKTVEDRRVLQNQSIFGGEAKSLPYLLAQMNLVLHGLESPKIDPLNSLRFPLREIGDRDRVDIIMTNPPFGGEEERGILGNFPEDKQTSETALLFLQLIMRKLKRQPKPGRAAVVVPNGTLFGDGICARIKEELLKDFNLHTIVRLPNGVFAPYTSIPTNLLFFDRSHPTEEVSGTTSSRFPKAGRITPKPNRSSSKNSPVVSSGGASAKRMTALGKCPHLNCSLTAATLIGKTPTPLSTSSISRLSNWPTIFSRKNSASRRSWKRLNALYLVLIDEHQAAYLSRRGSKIR